MEVRYLDKQARKISAEAMAQMIAMQQDEITDHATQGHCQENQRYP